MDNHLETNQYRHKNKKHLRVGVSTGNASFASRHLLTAFKQPQLLRQFQQLQVQQKASEDLSPRGTVPSVAPQQKLSAPTVVKTLPLSAARRLAKLCLETQSGHGHKVILFSSLNTVYARRGAICGPLLSKHLKGRRARADSYSSSSSESAGLAEPVEIQSKMSRHFSSMYDSVQNGVSRLTEDLASSLHLEKPISASKPEYMTSPSAASTYSEHSLFSETSSLSNQTNHSLHPISDAGHYIGRTSVAHPSAQRILSLRHHSPDSTPKKSYVRPNTATHRRHSQFSLNACTPLDDSQSRYFSRRNAIAPIADAEYPPKRTGTSSFGPIRTSRGNKVARTPLTVSHVRFALCLGIAL